MTKLALAFAAGCVAGMTFMAAVHDWSMRAHAGEKAACRDEPDRKAYMLRAPGESHSVESCQHVMRYSDPKWIPAFGAPIVANTGIKGRPGQEQQLTYVREMCRKLARQLRQKC